MSREGEVMQEKTEQVEEEVDFQVQEQEDYKRACAVIPKGVQTESKRPDRHVAVYPKFLERGKGAYVWDTAGNKYLDYPCSLGAILLGYAHPVVNQAIHRQIESGFLFSLPHRLETILAEKLCELVPCCESIRFLKTGSEAVSAAIKIARAATGNDGIVFCGYHGWHDTYNVTTSKKKGVPKYLSRLSGQFKYNDLEDLTEFFSLAKSVEYPIAAVVMEPYVFEAPQEGFLEGVRDLAHSNGALLIFDEIVTGFRTKGWSAQKYLDITPDLTCLGKAMGNGVPISAIGGKKEFMRQLEGDCFVSSTFGGDLLGIAASLATIKVLEESKGIEKIWNAGERLKNDFNTLAEENGLAAHVKCVGFPSRTSFQFKTEAQKSLFWQECLKSGVLFGYAQFTSCSHGEEELQLTQEAMSGAMKKVAQYFDDPESALEGKVAEATFRLVTQR